MRVAILGQKGNWHTAVLQAALARHGVEAPCFPITSLIARVTGRPWLVTTSPQATVTTSPQATVTTSPQATVTTSPPVSPRADGGAMASVSEGLEDYDVVLVRGIPGGSLEQIIFRVDVLHRLENAGVRVINSPLAIERTVDKYYTSTLLEDAGLSTPRTVVTEQFDQALAAFHELGGDVVVKPLFGSEGRGMVRVSDPDTAYRALRALELGRYVYYLQEFVPHGCEDIRVFVVSQEVVAAMVRQGQTWKTNIAQGAKAVPLAPDASLSAIACQAAQAVGADYAGIDILATEGGRYTVIEVNGIPGWQGLQEVAQVDIAGRLVEYALGRAQ